MSASSTTTTLEGMLVEASQVKEWLTNSANTGLDVRYNVWVKFLIQEQQFVFMFFVIVMRIALLLFFTAIQFLWRRREGANGAVAPNDIAVANVVIINRHRGSERRLKYAPQNGRAIIANRPE